MPLDVLIPHASLAVVGLILWALFTANRRQEGSELLAWVSVGAIVVVALLGTVMIRIWIRERRVAEADAPAEGSFPASLVVLHGVGATVTIVLVLLAALRL